mmetsp:Transcript_6301/g.13212  ORF Transcript_6301/g.13212 Transcript_6301/m.13212 type:complete len:224 (-) Transcript_6301:1217-1888(-)
MTLPPKTPPSTRRRDLPKYLLRPMPRERTTPMKPPPPPPPRAGSVGCAIPPPTPWSCSPTTTMGSNRIYSTSLPRVGRTCSRSSAASAGRACTTSSTNRSRRAPAPPTPRCGTTRRSATPSSPPANAGAPWPSCTTSAWSSGAAARDTRRRGGDWRARRARRPTRCPRPRRGPRGTGRGSESGTGWTLCPRMCSRRSGGRICGGGWGRRWHGGRGYGPLRRCW